MRLLLIVLVTCLFVPVSYACVCDGVDCTTCFDEFTALSPENLVAEMGSNPELYLSDPASVAHFEQQILSNPALAQTVPVDVLNKWIAQQYPDVVGLFATGAGLESYDAATKTVTVLGSNPPTTLSLDIPNLEFVSVQADGSVLMPSGDLYSGGAISSKDDVVQLKGGTFNFGAPQITKTGVEFVAGSSYSTSTRDLLSKERIKRIQHHLMSRNLLPKLTGSGKQGIDGIYGSQTQEAVRKLQAILKDQGLYAGSTSGNYDKATDESFRQLLDAELQDRLPRQQVEKADQEFELHDNAVVAFADGHVVQATDLPLKLERTLGGSMTVTSQTIQPIILNGKSIGTFEGSLVLTSKADKTQSWSLGGFTTFTHRNEQGADVFSVFNQKTNPVQITDGVCSQGSCIQYSSSALVATATHSFDLQILSNDIKQLDLTNIAPGVEINIEKNGWVLTGGFDSVRTSGRPDGNLQIRSKTLTDFGIETVVVDAHGQRIIAEQVLGAARIESTGIEYGTGLSRSRSFSTDVQQLQEQLRKHGYLTDSADGYFGPNTEQAVKALQAALKEKGLYAGEVDGVFDHATDQGFLRLLNEAGSSQDVVAEQQRSETRTPPPPQVESTEQGTPRSVSSTKKQLAQQFAALDVRSKTTFLASYNELPEDQIILLQSSLKALGKDVAITGKWDPALTAALKEFQRDRGIGDDAVVGPSTQRELVAALNGRAPATTLAPVHQVAASATSLGRSLGDLGRSKLPVNGVFYPSSGVSWEQVNIGRQKTGYVDPNNPFSRLTTENFDPVAMLDEAIRLANDPRVGFEMGTKGVVKGDKLYTDCSGFPHLASGGLISATNANTLWRHSEQVDEPRKGDMYFGIQDGKAYHIGFITGCSGSDPNFWVCGRVSASTAHASFENQVVVHSRPIKIAKNPNYQGSQFMVAGRIPVKQVRTEQIASSGQQGSNSG